MATGLPTKTEQSDLNEMLYGSTEKYADCYGSSTIEECFYFTIEAFNLAEKYQCVVIVASDLVLGLSKQTIAAFDYAKVKVEREGFITDEELSVLNSEQYKRYALTDSGVSPRSIPGQPKGMHVALSNEHDEIGREEAEDPYNRVSQMDKRFRKLKGFCRKLGTKYCGPDNPELC